MFGNISFGIFGRGKTKKKKKEKLQARVRDAKYNYIVSRNKRRGWSNDDSLHSRYYGDKTL